MPKILIKEVTLHSFFRDNILIHIIMNKTIKSLTAALLFCGVAMTSCKQEQPKMQAAVYNTMTISTDSRVLENSYSSTIRGCQDIAIYPQVGGTLQRLFVTEGQRVKKGQTLFIIDQVPFQAALNTAEANLKAAEAAQATAELTYKSTQKLFEQNVVSEFDLQKSQNALLSAQASVAQMKAMVVNAKNNLSYTVVKSPSDGVVGELPYRQGALVGSSMPKPLTTVSDNNEMYVYFSMNENELLSMIRQYGSVENAIKNMPAVNLILSDGSLLPETGRIESISGVIDPSTGSVQVRTTFPNKSNLLHSGSNGNVKIPVNYNNVIVIPQAATFELQDKILVYKVVDGKAVSTNITVAQENNGQEYIVTGGLEVGDVIIAEGAGLVREGTPVATQQEQK